MIALVRSYINKLRRAYRLLWGNAWHLRSKFTGTKSRRLAQTYLKEHQENLIFVFGTGRSGTQLVSDLLNASGNTTLFHEPNFGEDVATMDLFRRDPELAIRYWEEFRGIEVYRRWLASPDSTVYGEVNGTIRYQVAAIKQLYPKSMMLLMVRDGRGVIRSLMGWTQFYNNKSKGAYALSPLKDDPFFEKWDHMSRFERLCWAWRDANESIMRTIPASNWIHLERIASDYDYFAEHFTRNTEINITESMWFEQVSIRSRNASSKYAFPAWADWSKGQQQAFIDICGETMSRLGYEI